MKKVTLVLTVVALALLVSFNAQAQNKMAVSVGPEVLIPMGSFSDAAKIGFGGTAEFEYFVNPNISVTAKSGYITWGAKTGDANIGATNVEVTWSGIPILVGGKYYFIPSGRTRVYGQFELGLFIFSGSSTVTIPGFGTQSASASSTEFTIAPALGFEIPAGQKGAIDLSVRYWGILSSGGASNVGARAAYKFFL
jgi:outer membrane protein W